MKVEQILKQLTPERVKKEVEAIQKTELPPELQKWVKEYEKVGERNEFFWKFIYRLNQIIQPFKIPKKYRGSNIEIRFLIGMFIILLDDLADRVQSGELLSNLSKIPFDQDYKRLSRLNKKERKYLKFTEKLWNYIKKTIKKYPRYKEFKNIFNYDIKQAVNAMNYACLVNRNPYLINKTEFWLYSPHTLQGMIDCSLDLMCLPKFNIKELSKVREVFWRAQKMARIVNCLSTWKRELNEKDLTSGVLAQAISSGLLNIENLNKNKINIINKISRSNIERKLLEEWHQCHNEIRYISEKTKSINSVNFLSQLKDLSLMYLITENYY